MQIYINYITASEDLEDQRATASAGKTTKPSVEQDASGSESEEEEDDVMDLLMKAQKMGREKAISTASARGVTEMKASRYPMLDKKKEEKDLSAAGLDRLLNQAVASGSNSLPMGDGNLNALITLELPKC